MPRKHFATHIITDENQIGFSACSYGKFKFGASSIGETFGKNLFNSFYEKNKLELLSYKTIIVYSSPYDFIPTATMSMALKFYQLLETKIGLKAEVKFSKISRQTTYSVDYGNLSAKERMELIGADCFKLEENVDPGDLLIMIDDIKITGSHERVINNMLNKYKLNNDCFFLYHAILHNPQIPPQFENFLNYSAINSTHDLTTITEGNDFIINTRFVKYILKLNKSSFNEFVSSSNNDILSAIIENAIGNEYQNIDDYKNNFEALKSELN